FFSLFTFGAAIYTSKRINPRVRLVANVVRWRWLSPVLQLCRALWQFRRLAPKDSSTIQP
ncbi:hypothetical protein E6C29_29750, partial [Klebsiella pneumoniae]|nr:hypothetical protein [Klebsiella pneumoniae]